MKNIYLKTGLLAGLFLLGNFAFASPGKPVEHEAPPAPTAPTDQLNVYSMIEQSAALSRQLQENAVNAETAANEGKSSLQESEKSNQTTDINNAIQAQHTAQKNPFREECH